DKAVILEEYVDSIHFLLSIGLEKGYTFSQITLEPEDIGETAAFTQVFSICTAFYQEQTKSNYYHLFKQLLQLANVLSLSKKDIIQAYHKKNEENDDRQDPQ